jgi:hypothetical protein
MPPKKGVSMLKKLSIWHWSLLIVVALFVGLLTVGLIKAVKEKGAGSGEAASWMQAIGSIGAIAAAFVVAASQRRADRNLEAEKRNIDELKRFEAVKAILATTNVVAAKFGKAWGDRQTNTLETSNIQYLSDCKASIAALPVFEIPDPDLVVYITTLPRALQLLIDALDNARGYSQLNLNIPFLNDITVPNAFNEILQLTSKAGDICDKQITTRKG